MSVSDNACRGSTSEWLKNDALSKSGKDNGVTTRTSEVTSQTTSNSAPPRRASRFASPGSSCPNAMTSEVIR